MRFSLAVALLASLSVLAIAACSPLTTFNTLTPKDPSVRLAQGVPYGEGPRRMLDIYAPRHMKAQVPVLVFFYGGGWNSGRRQDYSFVARALASRGFLTIVPDYRVYPEVRYPDFLEDGAAAIRWAQDHAAEYGGDPARIVLAGHSAGGYNAVMLALDQEFIKAAGVRPGVVKAAAGLAGPYDFYPFNVDSTRDTFSQYPDPQATQPFNYVTKNSVPIWMGYGTEDKIVGPQNMQTLDRVMTEKGAPHETRLYQGLDHPGIVLALSQPFRRRGPVLDDMVTYLKAQVGE